VAVRDFERTHGANSCSVAACLLHDAENRHASQTGTPKYRSSRHDWSGDNSAQIGAAYDYARTHPEEMSVWYRANDGQADPLVHTSRRCTCVPRRPRGNRDASCCQSRERQGQGEGDGQYFGDNSRFLGGYGSTTVRSSLFSWALRHRHQHPLVAGEDEGEGEGESRINTPSPPHLFLSDVPVPFRVSGAAPGEVVGMQESRFRRAARQLAQFLSARHQERRAPPSSPPPPPPLRRRDATSPPRPTALPAMRRGPPPPPPPHLRRPRGALAMIPPPPRALHPSPPSPPPLPRRAHEWDAPVTQERRPVSQVAAQLERAMQRHHHPAAFVYNARETPQRSVSTLATRFRPQAPTEGSRGQLLAAIRGGTALRRASTWGSPEFGLRLEPRSLPEQP
jgi:hypothetical protein